MKFNLSGTILRIVGEERRLSIRLPREKLKNARVPSPRLVYTLTFNPAFKITNGLKADSGNTGRYE